MKSYNRKLDQRNSTKPRAFIDKSNNSVNAKKLVYQQAPNPRALPTVAPPYTVRIMKYQDSILVRVNVGNQYIFFRMRLNGLYDMDPSLFTSGISGFSELGGFYRRWRVPRFRIEWTITNKEVFDVTAVFLPAALDLNTTISSANLVLDMAENPLAYKVVVGSVNGNNVKTLRTRWIDIGAELHGDALHYRNDSIYSGLAGPGAANPNTMFFGNFGLAAGSNFTVGVGSALTVIVEAYWYERQTQEDRAYMAMLGIVKELELPTSKIPTREEYLAIHSNAKH